MLSTDCLRPMVHHSSASDISKIYQIHLTSDLIPSIVGWTYLGLSRALRSLERRLIPCSQGHSVLTNRKKYKIFFYSILDSFLSEMKWGTSPPNPKIKLRNIFGFPLFPVQQSIIIPIDMFHHMI